MCVCYSQRIRGPLIRSLRGFILNSPETWESGLWIKWEESIVRSAGCGFEKGAALGGLDSPAPSDNHNICKFGFFVWFPPIYSLFEPRPQVIAEGYIKVVHYWALNSTRIDDENVFLYTSFDYNSLCKLVKFKPANSFLLSGVLIASYTSTCNIYVTNYVITNILSKYILVFYFRWLLTLRVPWLVNLQACDSKRKTLAWTRQFLHLDRLVVAARDRWP